MNIKVGWKNSLAKTIGKSLVTVKNKVQLKNSGSMQNIEEQNMMMKGDIPKDFR